MKPKHYLKTLEETVRQQLDQKALCDYEGDAAFTDDGWFRTGDLGLLDEENNIFIRGHCQQVTSCL